MTRQLTIHSSQFPDRVRHDLIESLRRREVNHKFHYDSIKQSATWLKVHQTYSPARIDPGCVETYERSFRAVAGRIRNKRVYVIGLGCGGGQKDARLLRALRKSRTNIFYSPVDVSTALVLAADQAGSIIIREDKCFPLVCDLQTARDLPDALKRTKTKTGATSRIFTFFGMIPNFEPRLILPRLASLMGESDWLLLSANLAPGPDYRAGVEKVLPSYDNQLTREWLMIFLTDLGIEKTDGTLVIGIEENRSGLKRIVARFHFRRRREIKVDEDRFSFEAGNSIRLFFSYRYTPALIASILSKFKFRVIDQWITTSQEEGVFLCRKS